MARRVEYNFSENGRIYPWDDWFDGDIWELREGTDFNTPLAGFRATTYGQAKRYGKRVRTSNPKEGVLVIQAYEE